MDFGLPTPKDGLSKKERLKQKVEEVHFIHSDLIKGKFLAIGLLFGVFPETSLEHQPQPGMEKEQSLLISDNSEVAMTLNRMFTVECSRMLRILQ